MEDILAISIALNLILIILCMLFGFGYINLRIIVKDIQSQFYDIIKKRNSDAMKNSSEAVRSSEKCRILLKNLEEKLVVEEELKTKNSLLKTSIKT